MRSVHVGVPTTKGACLWGGLLIELYLAWPRVRSNTVRAYARRCVVNAAMDDRRSHHVGAAARGAGQVGPPGTRRDFPADDPGRPHLGERQLAAG
jgi:hypothetical protein